MWKILTVSILIAILALAIYFIRPYLPKIGFFGLTTQKEKVEEKIVELYELANPGVAIEVVSVDEESGIYKFLLKFVTAVGPSYREVFVTKDGRLLTESIIYVEESIERMNSFKNFVECLADNNVKIYGVSNETATLLQLNLLGRYSNQLFVPCDGALVTNCLQANVSQIPSVVIDGEVHPGLKTIDWFEQNTNCSLE